MSVFQPLKMYTSNIYYFNHTWKVKNLWLEKLLTKILVVSEGLYIPQVPELEWKILLVPHNKFIGVFLSVEGEKIVDGVFDVKFVNAKKDKVFGLNSIHFSTAQLENDIGHKEFMQVQQFVENYFLDNELSVWCQIIIANVQEVPRIYQYELQEETEFHLSALLEDFKSLYGNVRFADMNLLVGKEVYRVHKLVLAIRSPVLAEKIQENCQEFTLNMHETDCDTIKLLLQYIYTGNVVFPSIESSMLLYTVANKYSIRCLEMYCITHIYSQLTITNAVDVYLFTRRQRQSELQRFCENFIAVNRERIKGMESFKNFKLQHPVIYYELSRANKKLYDKERGDHTYTINL